MKAAAHKPLLFFAQNQASRRPPEKGLLGGINSRRDYATPREANPADCCHESAHSFRFIPVQLYQPLVINGHMHHTFILALVEKPHVSFLDALPHLAGMLMVIVTLSILWGVCAFTAKLILLLTPAPAAPVTASTAAPAARPDPQPVPVGIAPEIVAVIAAAVATAAGPNHRIISIKHQSTGWEKAGRQSVLSSHRIR